MNNIAIRPLFGTHLTPEYFSLLNELSPTPAVELHEAGEIFRKRLRQGWYTVVALDGNRLVGTASLLIERKLLRGGATVGHIEDVVVNQNARGRGVGRLLINHLISRCQQMGCYKVVLTCGHHVASFYERCEFSPDGRLMRRNLNRASGDMGAESPLKLTDDRPTRAVGLVDESHFLTDGR
jgi:glucosamine-phosphate N-acetyltransferase